ncbi:MAG: MATE family efflux transporter [Ignavibacteria bacterium]|nr:MATE family efflux transporter [Ignavibacteria bacterium]
MFSFPSKAYSHRIMRVATPAIAGMSTQMIVSIIETALVGRLGSSEIALAAMGLGVLATWTFTSFFSSLATGTHILVARRYGEGKYTDAGFILNNSLIISLAIGILFGVLGYVFALEFINLFAADSEVAFAAAEYIRYRSLGLPFFLLTVSYRGFFYGIGHTKMFLFSALIAYFVNLVLDYILIYGKMGFPMMGVGGAGLAASIGMLVSLAFFVVVTFLSHYRKKYRYYQFFRVSWHYMARIVRISLPVSFQNILILFGFLMFVAITGLIGRVEQAATQVVITALFLSFMPCFGFGIAAQTLVGNSLGNNQRTVAQHYGTETAKLATLFTIVVGLLFLLLPEAVLRVITNNETVIETARPVLQLAGVAQIAYGSGIVIAHALQAAGATLYVMYVEILTHWIVFLPFSYVVGVTFGYGIFGAWMALPVYVVSYSFLTWSKFLSGSWKTIKI